MDPESGWVRKPKDQLRHWSTYETPSDYWADYGGYVPIQMIHGISRAMRRLGLTFVAAYALLLERGAIVELDTARRATQLAQPPSNITVTAGKGAPMASKPRGTSERNAR